MSFHNQSEFIISTGNKRPQEISKILNSTLEQAIKSMCEFYINDNKLQFYNIVNIIKLYFMFKVKTLTTF